MVGEPYNRVFEVQAPAGRVESDVGICEDWQKNSPGLLGDTTVRDYSRKLKLFNSS